MSEMSLSGFVNVGKLEDVIHSLLQRMDAQQCRIDALERSAAQSVSVASFQALSARLESTIEHLNTQFGAIDQRLAEVTVEMAAVQLTLQSLPALRADVDSKVDAETWRRGADESRTDLGTQLASLRNEKASKAVVSSLETSQHRLVEEVLALQKLLACKIDRVEVPLLDVAAEKLQFLLDFQSSADARIDRAEVELAHVSRALQSKEGRESAAKTAAALREEMGKKVDAAFIKEQVLAPLHHAEDEIVRLKASEEALDKLMDDYHEHIEKFARMEKTLHEARSEATRVAKECRSLAEEVGHKADQSSIDRIVFDNSDEIEKIVRSYDSKSAHDSKVQAAYLSDVRLQIEEMQNYQNQVDQKLQMALKFIDWFTDVKMKHM